MGDRESSIFNLGCNPPLQSSSLPSRLHAIPLPSLKVPSIPHSAPFPSPNQCLDAPNTPKSFETPSPTLDRWRRAVGKAQLRWAELRGSCRY